MPIFIIRHRTTYSYSNDVMLGPQRLVVRPRDSHDLRLLDATLTVSPPPARTRWIHDVYDNSIAILEFETATRSLVIESRLLIDNFGYDKPKLPVESFAETWPFGYRAWEAVDLEPWIRRQYDDPEGRVARWLRELIRDRVEWKTQDLLVAIMRRIKEDLPYRERQEEGIRSPLETLAKGGTCRDFAVLMIEAVRALGFAARFVSGYLHAGVADPAIPSEAVADGAVSAEGRRTRSSSLPESATPPPPAILGGGSTHAWVQIYLPGAGWVEFDPTNALYGGADLVRVAIAREPSLVSPISGSFEGPMGVRSTMAVEVDVARAKAGEAAPTRLS